MSRATEIEVSEFVKKQKLIPKVSANDMYVSASEYAMLIGMHRVTIGRLLRAGKIDGAIKVGGHWRIPVRD